MEAENFDLYTHHFIFVKDQGEAPVNKLELINTVSNNIVNLHTRKQIVLVYFINDFSFSKIEQEFYKNDEDPNEYFKNNELTVSEAIIHQRNSPKFK